MTRRLYELAGMYFDFTGALLITAVEFSKAFGTCQNPDR